MEQRCAQRPGYRVSRRSPIHSIESCSLGTYAKKISWAYLGFCVLESIEHVHYRLHLAELIDFLLPTHTHTWHNFFFYWFYWIGLNFIGFSSGNKMCHFIVFVTVRDIFTTIPLIIIRLENHFSSRCVCDVILQCEMWPISQNHLTAQALFQGLSPCNRPWCTIDLFAFRQKVLLQFISETGAASIPSGEPAATCRLTSSNFPFSSTVAPCVLSNCD